jgi:phospho-N-acetylmuramoyl-pentapeptide-transferase
MIFFLYEIFDINILQYVTFRAAAAAITALSISFLLGPKIIRTLHNHHIGESIRENGPSSHYLKEGTPTMGGIITISTLLMGLVGFVDDYLKIVKKLSKGLIARYKLISQVLIGIFISFMVLNYIENPKIFIDVSQDAIKEISNTSISLPFIMNGFMVVPKWIYIILVIIVITATSNSVNLTDGLDGLSTGLSAISILTMGAIAYASGRSDFSDYLNILYIKGADELLIFCFATIGACLGFLWYNSHPATVFMGDTGSLALGTALGTLAILLKKEILLIIIGGVFVIESLSVIIQVLYFKYTKRKYGTGKKIFLMAPIHHHFEEKGLPESKVVVRFWIIGILLALFSLSSFKLQ